jgi:hypothetical protein
MMKNPFIVMPIDLAYPFFCGVVASAWLCFFSIFPHFETQMGVSFCKLAASLPVQEGNSLKASSRNVSQAPVPPSDFPVPAFNHHFKEREDPILNAYRNETQQHWVTTFFTGVLKPESSLSGTTTEEMAKAILSNASAFDISPSLAFALCWAESQFNPMAVNRTNRDGSIDRGLFQLNSRSFPKMKEADFFNPSINAYYGMAHLRWCLDTGGSVVAGLAMYNAGTNRVKADGTPKRTLDYISYVLEFQWKIEDTFASHPLPVPIPVTEELASELDDLRQSEEVESYFAKPRLTLLTPIAGRF